MRASICHLSLFVLRPFRNFQQYTPHDLGRLGLVCTGRTADKRTASKSHQSLMTIALVVTPLAPPATIVIYDESETPKMINIDVMVAE